MTEIQKIEHKIDILTNCRHEKVELRFITNSHEKKMYVHQCLFCGRKTGNWIKHRDVREICVPFNEKLEDQASRLHHEIWNLKQAGLDQDTHEWREKYDLVISSIDWLNVRDKALTRDNYTCQGCLEARATQVHHLTYKHLGSEFLFELISLCDDCHKRIHE